jgi:hypothetical protein
MDPTLPNGVIFEIDYTKWGRVKTKGAIKLTPPRPYDFRDETDVLRDHEGNPIGTVEYWFEEGICVTESREYDDEADVNSLKVSRAPGACTICPVSGHLMWTANDETGWNFSSKRAQAAYMDWLCDQTFVGTDEAVQ